MLTIKNRAMKVRGYRYLTGVMLLSAEGARHSCRFALVTRTCVHFLLKGLKNCAVKRHKSRAPFTMLVLSFAFLSGCTPAGPKALLEGKRLIDQKKYLRAVERLNYATSILNTNAQAWNYLGVAYHHAGQPQEAERSYRRALSLNHDLTEARYNLACLLLAQNKAEKNESAKTELLAYTLRRGNSVEGFLKLGLAQLRLRELAGAEKSFGDALRLSPQNPEALNGMGLVRFQRNRSDEAIKYFRTALKYKPDYGPAILNLAVVAEESFKDRALAIRAFREYTVLKPTPPDAEAVRFVASQLEQELKTASVRAATNPVVTLLTNKEISKPISTNPAVRTANSNPPKIAQSTIAPKPLSVEPTPPSANYETVKLAADPVIKAAQAPPAAAVETRTSEIPDPEGQIPTPAVNTPAPSVSAGKQEPAQRGFFQRVNPFNLFQSEGKKPSTTPIPRSMGASEPSSVSPTLSSSNPTTENAKGLRYAYHSFPLPIQGNRQEAQPLFDQAVRAQQARRLAEAMKGYTQAVEKDPSFFEAYYNLGLAATEAKDLPGALRAYEKALAARSDSLDARYNFALVLKQANYITDAVNELEKVVVAYPKESRAHLALGNMYAQQLSQPAKAREHYLLVLDCDPRNSQATAIRYWLAANPPSP
jgi:tetratricopeptide (TPR) repeat protein